MGLFDNLVKAAKTEVSKNAGKAITEAINQAASSISGKADAGVKVDGMTIGKGTNRDEIFTFSKLPTSVSELQALPEANLDSAFKTAALTIACLCHFESSPEETFAMLDVLKGPEPLSIVQKQFIAERLQGKTYKPFSFFQGATPENHYKPTVPYKIKISENPYSFDEENWAILHVESSGADSLRQIKLRKKPSTGQWFLNDILCLSDIRIPTEEDPWA